MVDVPPWMPWHFACNPGAACKWSEQAAKEPQSLWCATQMQAISACCNAPKKQSPSQKFMWSELTLWNIFGNCFAPWTVIAVSVCLTSTTFQAEVRHSMQNDDQQQAQDEAKCTAPKAACLLSCLQMKIVSSEWTKPNVAFERGSAQDLMAWSSVDWDEWCFNVKNWSASHVLVDNCCHKDSSCCKQNVFQLHAIASIAVISMSRSN